MNVIFCSVIKYFKISFFGLNLLYTDKEYY